MKNIPTDTKNTLWILAIMAFLACLSITTYNKKKFI